jgi:hypothetical protein
MRGIVTVGRVSLSPVEAEDWANAFPTGSRVATVRSRAIPMAEPGENLSQEDGKGLPRERVRLGCV